VRGVAAAGWSVRRALPGAARLGSASLLGAAGTCDAALAVLQGLAVARVLGPDGYGQVTLLTAYAGVLQGVLDPRSSDATVKFAGQALADGDRTRAAAVCTIGYLVDLAVAALALGVVAATAPWASVRVLHAPECAPLLVLHAAGFLPRALAGTSTAVLQTAGRFGTIAAVQLGGAVVRTALVVGLVTAGLGVRGVVLGLVVATTLHGLWLLAAARAEMRRAWGWTWNAARRRPLRGRRRALGRFLALNDVNVLLALVVKQLDTLVLGWWRGPAEAGFYRLARSTGGLAGLLVFPLQTTTYPVLAAAAPAARRAFVRRWALRIGLPAGGAVLLCAPFVPDVLAALVGPRYAGAAGATRLVLAGSAIWLGSFWLRPLVLAEGRLGRYTRDYAVSLVPVALGYAVLAPRLGAEGMALGYLGHNVLLFALAGTRGLR